MEGLDWENFKSKKNVIDVTSSLKPYSFLNEDNIYDTADTPTHMMYLYQELLERGILK